jgi:hypothetical protein
MDSVDVGIANMVVSALPKVMAFGIEIGLLFPSGSSVGMAMTVLPPVTTVIAPAILETSEMIEGTRVGTVRIEVKVSPGAIVVATWMVVSTSTKTVSPASKVSGTSTGASVSEIGESGRITELAEGKTVNRIGSSVGFAAEIVSVAVTPGKRVRGSDG